MGRLTNEHRRIIAKRAITEGFREREDALKAQEAALAVRAHSAVFSADALAAVAALPKGWVRYDTCLNFTADRMRIKLTAAKPLPVPYEVDGSHGYHCHSSLGVIKDEELAREIVGIARAKEALRDERSAAENALMATLMKVSTAEALAKSWPEGLPFYQGFLVATVSVPAVRFADINAMIGLQPAA